MSVPRCTRPALRACRQVLGVPADAADRGHRQRDERRAAVSPVSPAPARRGRPSAPGRSGVERGRSRSARGHASNWPTAVGGRRPEQPVGAAAHDDAGGDQRPLQAATRWPRSPTPRPAGTLVSTVWPRCRRGRSSRAVLASTTPVSPRPWAPLVGAEGGIGGRAEQPVGPAARRRSRWRPAARCRSRTRAGGAGGEPDVCGHARRRPSCWSTWPAGQRRGRAPRAVALETTPVWGSWLNRCTSATVLGRAPEHAVGAAAQDESLAEQSGLQLPYRGAVVAELQPDDRRGGGGAGGRRGGAGRRGRGIGGCGGACRHRVRGTGRRSRSRRRSG